MSWRNWQAHRLGCRRSSHAFEAAVYSDTYFTGSLEELGPFAVLNTIARSGVAPVAGVMSLALVVRVDQYGREHMEWTNPEEATPGSYHGGSLVDEIAGLLSLALGVRAHAGGPTRFFVGTRDRGTPFQPRSGPPYLSSPEWVGRSQIPNIAREVSLDEAVAPLSVYSKLTYPAATALVRASRLFQQALWNADGDPYTSWIQLVSAVEVAADFHVRYEQSDWDMLREHWQDLAAALSLVAPKQRGEIAALLAPQVRAARKYRTFLKEFNPREPRSGERGASWERVDWSPSSLLKAETVIYKHRSAALHRGTPFPLPMCVSPGSNENGGYREKPLGKGSISGDTFWSASQLPMHLHLYVYIVGEALRGWWRQLPRLTDE